MSLGIWHPSVILICMYICIYVYIICICICNTSLMPPQYLVLLRLASRANEEACSLLYSQAVQKLGPQSPYKQKDPDSTVWHTCNCMVDDSMV